MNENIIVMNIVTLSYVLFGGTNYLLYLCVDASDYITPHSKAP